ncbi:MAG: hypothetical protein HY885_13800 [Deltaproteobacteria bacterium]|nr:hypothetical protein [Deltaproteobacteria bacterium]
MLILQELPLIFFSHPVPPDALGLHEGATEKGVMRITFRFLDDDLFAQSCL